MTKYLKSALYILLLTSFLQHSYAQNKADIKDSLALKFLRYCKEVPREEIFMHTDREEYIAGEDLWFKVYLIDRQTSGPSFNSRITYFELLNSENRPVVQRKILLDKGTGPGQIVLPDTLSSGTYTLRAYTSWMKNFLPVNCYMKEIKIYNALTKSGFKNKIYSDNNPGKAKIHDINPVNSDSVIILRVNNLNTDTLEITVAKGHNFSSVRDSIFYLFIHTHGIITHLSQEKILSDFSGIVIPKNELLPGISHITIFDSNGQPLNERFVYIPERKNAFLTVNSADSYKKREKISLDVLFNNESGEPSEAKSLSISVTPRIPDSGNMEINDYMIFGSEFGLPSSVTFKSRKINELAPGKIDSLLMTLKSNWIDWSKILAVRPPELKYQFENKEHYITGELLDPDHNSVQPGKYLLLSNPGKVAGFQYARTDEKGSFRFRIHIDESVKDLVIQPDDITINYKINIESSFSDKYLEARTMIDSAGNQIPSYIADWSTDYQVNKIYETSATTECLTSLPEPADRKRFYGKPDIELIMADYIKLPVMQEVFTELLHGAYIKTIKSGYEIIILDPVDHTASKVAPTLMIDGVIIRDPSIIVNLDPELVEEIDVIKEKYHISGYLFYGILNVITKAGDFSCAALPSYAIRIPERVIDPVLSFVSPEYTSTELKNSRIPDFRNTLYWNPDVSPDKDGDLRIEFWSSDKASDYNININGMTSEGKTFSFSKIIRVE